ncbi:hypothetical protein KCP74_19580 [Salmonella enterica subsp. enterica]|nr:hypothetical protein KCP74_19580 [Salmonella enterica subsp. enterica]
MLTFALPAAQRRPPHLMSKRKPAARAPESIASFAALLARPSAKTVVPVLSCDVGGNGCADGRHQPLRPV